MAKPVVSYVVNKLGDYLLQEASLLHGVRDEVEWLQRELCGMMCFLRDADSKRKGSDQRVKNWVKDVREVAYDVEDVIDTFLLKVGRSSSSIHRYTSPLTSMIPRYKVGKKIEKIKARLVEISAQRDRYGIVNLGEDTSEESRFLDENIQARRRLSPHHYDDRSIVGLEEDTEKILQQLLDAKKRLCVVSIVGMGGLGKTTLAKKVYHCRQVVAKFQTRAWVSVSEDFRVTELLKKIIKEITGTEDTEHMEEEELKRNLYELMQNQGRFLLVMDDVWRREVWERVATALPDMENGSRVIFTTRDKDVAKRANPSMHPYELQLLGKTESQKLFLKKVFPYEDIQAFPKDLEDVGERLVSKCHGLPLALEVLGGLLSIREKNHHQWSRVLNSSDWQSTEGCRAILSLSYKDLPYELKLCFLYIGSFPEDSVINAQRLIGLWVAEGFIPQRSPKEREETARDFLDELVQRCLVQVADRRRYDGMIWSIHIHDLLRDLCLDEAREDGFFVVKRLTTHFQLNEACTSSDVMTARRFALYDDQPFGDLNYSIKHMRHNKLHTFLYFNLTRRYAGITKIRGQDLDGLKLLRVIDIDMGSHSSLSSGTIVLPKEISAMIHLRYLRLTITKRFCKVILPSINNLLYLQTLAVSGLIVESKDGIGNLIDLRELQGIRAGTWIGRDLSKLTNLQKLQINEIDVSHGKALGKSLGKLKCLEELNLSGQQNIPMKALMALSSLPRLRVLILIEQVSVLSNSYCLQSLTTLTLRRTLLWEDPMPVLEKLPNLIHLCLDSGAFMGRSMSCSIGGFPQLLQMDLRGLHALEKFRVEAKAMPCLIYLTIFNCMNLKELPKRLQHVTILRELDLGHMPYEFKDRVRQNRGRIDIMSNMSLPSSSPVSSPTLSEI